MIKDTNLSDKNREEATDSDQITYTQVGCCAADDYTKKAQRLSLRARLKREREERTQRRQSSFINSVRNLFGSIQQ